ncbi:MAG: hypothetical protein ED557_07900 [Balneola sp.]|nr:MAG: hypothetical protein ED557_07900 [Balneola sp.]
MYYTFGTYSSYLILQIIKAIILKYRKLPFILLLLATGVIFIGTLYPADRLYEINIWDYDKIGHFLAFAIWTFLLGIVWALKKKETPSLFWVFVYGLSFGLLIEFLQFMLPTNRSPELYDFIADGLGSGFAILILPFFFRQLFKD